MRGPDGVAKVRTVRLALPPRLRSSNGPTAVRHASVAAGHGTGGLLTDATQARNCVRGERPLRWSRNLAPSALASAALITAAATIAVALVSGFFAWYVPAWKARRDARVATEHALRLTRDPLLRAAFELQSRFYNIVVRDFLKRYLTDGSPDERHYAILSTLWVIAQYLGWVEILRREVQYLDLGSRAVNRTLQLRLSEVSAAMASDARPEEAMFVIFRADQRAIGEFMVTSRITDAGSRPDCLGYSEFVERLDATVAQHGQTTSARKPPVIAWAERTTANLEAAPNARHRTARLVNVQRRLIDLVDLLDADRVRYPELNFRGKVPKRSPSSGRRGHVARFLWRTGDVWSLVEEWADLNGFTADSASLAGRTYLGKRGPTLTRPEIVVAYHDAWVTLDARMARRKRSHHIDGSLRATRGRRATNTLLRSFDRPVIAEGSTIPSRAWTAVARQARRTRRAAEDHGS